MPDQLFFDIVKMVVALACIVGLLFFVVWLMKKLVPGISRSPIQRVDLGVISQISLGARQRIAVLRVADRTLVVGVTEGSITTLAELDLPKAAPATQKEADDPKIFADLLSWPKDSPAPAEGAAPVAQPVQSGPSDNGSRHAPARPVEDDGPRLFAPGERPAR